MIKTSFRWLRPNGTELSAGTYRLFEYGLLNGDGSGIALGSLPLGSGLSAAIQIDGGNQYVNLVVTPEPTTLGLAAVGLAGLALRRRRSN